MNKKIPDDVSKFLFSAADIYGRYTAEEFGQFMWHECAEIDSPIEQLFLIALNVMSHINCVKFSLNRTAGRQPETLLVERQMRSGKFRVDFALSYCTTLPTVCIELDGHQFHDRDEKQRRYEKQRDRYLVTHGFVVLHFTGSEVVKDPYAVALEAFNAATKLDEVSIHPADYMGS